METKIWLKINLFLAWIFLLILPLAAAAEESFDFAVFGDSEDYGRGYNPEFKTMIGKAEAKDPDFSVFTGDILANGASKLASYRSWITTVKSELGRHFKKSYIAFGKHDIECGLSCINLWTNSFWGVSYRFNQKIKLYHSFDYKNTHIVLLSSDYPLKHNLDNAQLNWLDQDLKTSNKPNKIVFTHVPPITFFSESAKNCHDMSCNPTQRKKLIQILKNNQVDLVISGHEHVYKHKESEGIDFFVSGNSGNGGRYGYAKKNIYSFVSVEGENITLQAINDKGIIEEEVKVK